MCEMPWGKHIGLYRWLPVLACDTHIFPLNQIFGAYMRPDDTHRLMGVVIL